MISTEWIGSIPLIGKILLAEQSDITFLDALPIIGLGLTTCLVCSVVCAFIGVHIILRRIVFVSAAISQVTSLGLAFALLVLSFFRNPEITEQIDNSSMLNIPGLSAVVASVLCAALFASRGRELRITRESILGVAYVLPSALVLLILDRLSTETHLIENILFGNTVFVSPLQLEVLGFITVIVLLIHILLFKEFISVAFDHDASKAAGMPVFLYEQLFYFTLALVISFAIGSIGVLPVFGFMIIPATASLLLTKRLKIAFLISVIFGLLSSSIGFYLSFLYSLPTGPAMLGVSGIILLISSFIYSIQSNK